MKTSRSSHFGTAVSLLQQQSDARNLIGKTQVHTDRGVCSEGPATLEVCARMTVRAHCNFASRHPLTRNLHIRQG